MRGFIASVLAFCLLVQSNASGAFAHTASTRGIPSLWQSLSDALNPLTAMVASRYAGTRRNPPPGRQIVTPAPVSTYHPQFAVRPTVRSGVQLAGPHMLARPLRLDEHPQDPRSLLHESGARRCSSSLHMPSCATPAATPNATIMGVRQSSTARIAAPMSFPTAFPTPIALPTVAQSRLAIPKIPAITSIAAMSNTRSASYTTSVQPFQYEADIIAGPNTPIFYTGGIESGALSREMDSAPASGAASNQTLTYTTANTAVSFGWVSPANVPNLTSWPAQNYTVTLNVTQPNANIKITAVRVLRVDSTGGGGGGDEGLAVVGGVSGLSQTLGSAGTLTFSISGTAQTASATDRVAVKIVVQSTVSGSQSFSYLSGPKSGSGVNVGGSGALMASATGFNPWWTYYTGDLPGQGGYAVNVGNGNLLAKIEDFDTPERGIDLAFQRVYNSSSTHDAVNSDASVPGAYGDGWTSSFDAHIAYHGSNTISVYDIDGTRFDYTADGNGGWTPPTGQYATLAWDGACGYQWTKTDGTVYSFYSPDLNAGTPPKSGSPSIVQTQTGAANATTSYNVPALATAPAVGHVLILAVGYDHTQSDVNTSLAGWTYVGKSTNDPTFWNTLYIWEKVVQSGDTGAATITSTTAKEFSSVEYEIAGASQSSPYEAFATSTAQNNTTITVTSGTPSVANDLPIAFFENRNYTTSALGSGWTEDARRNSNGTSVEAQHGPTDSNATAQTAQVTWSTASYPVGAILLIQPASPTLTCANPYPQGAAYGGRLYQIWGRNYNNKLSFAYSWAGGDASNSANLTGITVGHSDGDTVSLTFGLINGAPELSSVSRPDGKTITYSYIGNTLSHVYLPGTNGPTTAAIPTLSESYYYAVSTHLLTTVYSPVYNQSSGSMGDETDFLYDASNRVQQIKDSGVVNFVPTDDTSPNTALQSGSTGIQTWTTTNFTWLSGETELSDMYGHYANWFVDSLGRVTENQRWSATPTGSGIWISTGLSWDSNNNLLSTIDPRGMVGATPDPTYETDFAYDTTGDLVAAAQPAVTVDSGTYRPTVVYSYDNNHNVTAICDAVASHTSSLDWVGAGQTGNPGTSKTRCPSITGALRYSFDYTDANEPYGRVNNYYTANGYHYTVLYDAASQGNVDAGLPTSVKGDQLTQSLDAATSTRTPTELLAYDSRGNLSSIDSGTVNANGVNKEAITQFSYDQMHRQISVTDADNHTSYVCYNDNGTVFYTETPSQHDADGSPTACATPLPASVAAPPNAVSYTYDADANMTKEVHHYGNTAGETQRWYDAGDRLVEVQLPLDSAVFPNTTIKHDLYPKPWMARYLYDNTGGLLWADGSGNGVYGAGHLYKVQEYLPQSGVIAANTVPAAQAWLDVRGYAYDALDVPVHQYEFAVSNSPRISYTYNGSNATMGMLYQMFYGQGPSATNPTVTPSYLKNGWVSQVSYSNDGGLTPGKSFTYDADGRLKILNSSTFGNEYRSYDNDGNLTSVIEPTTYGAYGSITYGYYEDDLLKSRSVSSTAFSVAPVITYGYRGDGLPELVQPSWTGTANFTSTYTAAGRPLTENDPYTGAVIPVYNLQNQTQTSSVTLVQRKADYDSYGRIKSLVLPEGYTYGWNGSSGSFTYDAEDEPTSYQLSNGLCSATNGTTVQACSPSTYNVTYSARGEILGSTNATNRQSADGFLCTPSSGGCKESFDARSGMVYSANGLSYGYDAFGRNTSVTMNGKAITRAYDADSHITSQQNLSGSNIACVSGVILGCDSSTSAVDNNAGATYTWGPNGHPVKYVSNITGTSAATYWEHWDPVSENVLFENGGTSSLALGHLGSSNVQNGVTVHDRDPFGQLAATHTGNQFTIWASTPAASSFDYNDRTIYRTGGQGSEDPSYDPQWSSQVLDESRLDAYVDTNYGISFQGVRTADVNSGQWMTPDWFGGYDGDLMSQQPYMWNNNNGLMYDDPSGYNTTLCQGQHFVWDSDNHNWVSVDDCTTFFDQSLFGSGYGYGFQSNIFYWAYDEPQHHLERLSRRVPYRTAEMRACNRRYGGNAVFLEMTYGSASDFACSADNPDNEISKESLVCGMEMNTYEIANGRVKVDVWRGNFNPLLRSYSGTVYGVSLNQQTCKLQPYPRGF